MHRQAELFHVVTAGRPTGSFAGLLHCRQQKADQHPNDSYHHQKFDKRKSESEMTNSLAFYHDETPEIKGAIKPYENLSTIFGECNPIRRQSVLQGCRSLRVRRKTFLRGTP
jgi:hypothetical protein